MTGDAQPPRGRDAVRRSFCRICQAYCGIKVEVSNGVVSRVMGDPENPGSRGFTCVKGRALPAQINHPDRLLRAMKRDKEGVLRPIASGRALDEVATRVRDLIDRHGPRSLALYAGNGVLGHAAGNVIAHRLWRTLGSPMLFTSGSIDQPGKPIALSMHGRWMAGMAALPDTDTWMFVGTNPLVSLWAGTGIQNPSAELRKVKRKGTRLVVVDPRRTRTASLADLYLQIKPGEDAALLAGIIRVILTRGHEDSDFCAKHVSGISELRTAVDFFDEEVVVPRTGISFEDICRAADMFVTARRAGASAGTGPNMAGWGTLTEYLLLALLSITGNWRGEGDTVRNPGVLIPPRSWRAEAEALPPAWGMGEQMRVRGLAGTLLGMPTAGAADEILLEGPGQVRALVVIGGNPVASWPDQLKTIDAMRDLDLLVCVELFENATTQFADYVFAGKHPLEVPATTQIMEEAGTINPPLSNWSDPYGMYTAAVVDPPAGSDVLDEAEIFHQLGRRLGVQLRLRGTLLDMSEDLSVDDVIESCAQGSRVPLEEVKRHEHGYSEVSSLTVDAGMNAGGRLNVGAPPMMDLLSSLSASLPPDPDYPMRLISRRMTEVCNSANRNISELKTARAYNPAYMHPADLENLRIVSGDVIQIESARAAILAVAESAPDVRQGVISCSHAWGNIPELDHDLRSQGSNVGRLISGDTEYDAWSGIPRMSAIPVRIRKAPDDMVRELDP
jgi:anaerobic selenocysteine-containing dehydrogenase